MNLILTPVGARILGCLIEKEATTPEYYPLSLNALVNACNQKSNREPVMTLSEECVDAEVEVLKERHIIWKRSVTGARVYKYEHNIKSLISLDEKELAVMCVLLLRGPQTVGEIRLRTERLCSFLSLDDAEKTVRAMTLGENATVKELPRQPGRKEARFVHLLCGQEWADAFGASSMVSGDGEMHSDVSIPKNDRVSVLETTVFTLQEEVAVLRRELDEIKRQLF